MAGIQKLCSPGSLLDPQKLLISINALTGKLNNYIGQAESLVKASANSINFAFGASSSTTQLTEFLRSTLSGCPGFSTLEGCLNAILNEIENGTDFGLGFQLSAPCLQAFIEDLIDVSFQCFKNTSEAYIDGTGKTPQDDIKQQLFTPPQMYPVQDLSYTRQDADVVLNWSANANNPTPTIYVIEIYGVRRAVTLDTFYTIRGLTPLRETEIKVYAYDMTLRFGSSPVSISVTVLDNRIPSDVTGLQVLGIGTLEAILAWNLSNFPHVIGYNLRWKNSPNGPENVYFLGNRKQITLRNLFTGPTTVRITAVTEWDESNGITVDLDFTNFTELNYSFNLPTYNPGDSGALTIQYSHNLAPAGAWHKVTLKNGNNAEDLPISPSNITPNLDTLIALFTIPLVIPSGGPYNMIEAQIYNQLGELHTLQVAIP